MNWWSKVWPGFRSPESQGWAPLGSLASEAVAALLGSSVEEWLIEATLSQWTVSPVLIEIVAGSNFRSSVILTVVVLPSPPPLPPDEAAEGEGDDEAPQAARTSAPAEATPATRSSRRVRGWSRIVRAVIRAPPGRWRAQDRDAGPHQTR